jgi:hypothetical protein
LENWTKHYWGEFLFISGDEIQRNKVPETGVLYLGDFVFIVFGLIFFVRNLDREKKLVLWWLLVAPVAAAMTFQSPHALRAHNMVIPLTIISAYGFVKILGLIKKRFKPQKLVLTCYLLLFTLMLWQFARYLHMYWIHMAKEYPYSSQYGMKELMEYVYKNIGDFDSVVITDRYDQPYILTLFYLKYPPNIFQQEHELSPRDKYGFSTVRNFQKFVFKPVSFEEDRVDYPRSLIIGTSGDIPREANIVKKINFPNGRPAYVIVAN